MLKRRYKGVVRQIHVDKRTYTFLREDFDPAFYSFGCPLRHKMCGELDEIIEESSKRNVFVAMPYVGYSHENVIRELLTEAGLIPKLAKQKIQTKMVLCKICRDIRKCGYGIVDISKNNVNVAYELGLMQSLGKNCAILLEAGTEAQSDLKGLENVLYDSSSKLKSELGRWMRDNITETDTKSLDEYLESTRTQRKESHHQKGVFS